MGRGQGWAGDVDDEEDRLGIVTRRKTFGVEEEEEDKPGQPERKRRWWARLGKTEEHGRGWLARRREGWYWG